MKKFILAILAVFAFAMTSCTTAEAVVYDEQPSVEYIISYGTPYYYNGVIIYYYYNGYMYYPKHHRIYYHHRHNVRSGWVNPGTKRPHRPHGYSPNGHKGGNGGHHGTRPGSRPGSVHNGNHGNHSGHNGHVGSGGRPSSPRRR